MTEQAVEGMIPGVGVVAIGRNEGERLRRCLLSVKDQVEHVVYVDSGSEDDSVEFAKSIGVEVVRLDLSTPFTAARARNEGVRRLLERAEGVEFVQVVDGDCELVGDWITSARSALLSDERCAVVCGRRRERFPSASVYNKLCDMEWDTPIGEAEACGGDALIRVEAFEQVGGYNGTIIAGEEPEMCVRMRGRGWTIQRIAHDMTLHDAEMTRFGQWWQRAVRGGHAYAEVHDLHPHVRGREVRSIIVWGFALPACSIGLIGISRGWSGFVGLLGYFLLYRRVSKHRLARGDDRAAASLYARYVVLGKFPQMIGLARYWTNRLLGRRSRIIEYKTSPVSG